MADVADITVEILRDIRDDMRDMRDGMHGLRDGMRGLRGDMRDLREAVDQTNARLDNLIELAGGRWRNHEERIEGLEGRMDDVEDRLTG